MRHTDFKDVKTVCVCVLLRINKTYYFILPLGNDEEKVALGTLGQLHGITHMH